MSALSGVGSRRSKLVFAGAVYLGLIATTAVFLFPLLWVIGLSLKTRLQVFATPPLFLWWPTFENYVGVLSQADFLQAFVNSLVVSSGAVLLSLCIGVPAAYAFARFPFRGGSFLFFSLLVMRMLPPIAVLVPMYILFSKFGLTTTRFSVVLAYTHVQPAAGGVDHARLLRGPAARTGGKRLGGWRVALRRVPPRRAAADPAGTGGGEHPVPAAGMERLPVRRRADQQRNAHAAGADGGVSPAATPASTGVA